MSAFGDRQAAVGCRRRLSATCWLSGRSGAALHAGGSGIDASAADDHCVNHAVVLEEHRKSAVVPARDRRLTDRGVARERGTEMLLDLTHGAAAFGAIELGRTHLHLVVHQDGIGDCGAGGGATAQERCENSGLHVTALQLLHDYSTAKNLSKRAGRAARTDL